MVSIRVSLWLKSHSNLAFVKSAAAATVLSMSLIVFFKRQTDLPARHWA